VFRLAPSVVYHVVVIAGSAPASRLSIPDRSKTLDEEPFPIGPTQLSGFSGKKDDCAAVPERSGRRNRIRLPTSAAPSEPLPAFPLAAFDQVAQRMGRLEYSRLASQTVKMK
jgi:hypothetical protein